MQRLVGLCLALVLVGTLARSQTVPRVYTQPALPSPEALEALDLKMAWRAYLPVDGRADGIQFFQMPKWDKFQLTARALDSLREQGVPDPILTKLKVLSNRRFLTRAALSGQLDRILTAQELKDHSAKVLQQTRIPTHQLLVQMRNGTVVMLDAETGEVHWRNRVGKPFNITVPAGYNHESVFVAEGPRLYALDRYTGQPQWQYDLPMAVSTAPLGDSGDPVQGNQLYLCLVGGQVYAYRLPPTGKLEEQPGPPPPPAKSAVDEIQLSRFRGSGNWDANKYSQVPTEAMANEPRRPAIFHRGQYTGPDIQQPYLDRPEVQRKPLFEWRQGTEIHQHYPPLMGKRSLVLLGEGWYFTIYKRGTEAAERFETAAVPAVAPVQHNDMCYVAARNSTLYAFELESGRTRWRVSAGGLRFFDRPYVLNDDLFFTLEGRGLHCLDRETGREIWRQAEAQYFLSVNRDFVYAADANHRLLILDRRRGSVLGRLDTRDFNRPLANEWNDRVYLAANNGLLLCLRDRRYDAPLVSKHVWDLRIDPTGKPVDVPKITPKENGAMNEGVMPGMMNR
jgi:outer membrane protein assembly factor BamB